MPAGGPGRSSPTGDRLETIEAVIHPPLTASTVVLLHIPETTAGVPASPQIHIPQPLYLQLMKPFGGERRLASTALWVQYFEWHFSNGAVS